MKITYFEYEICLFYEKTMRFPFIKKIIWNFQENTSWYKTDFFSDFSKATYYRMRKRFDNYKKNVEKIREFLNETFSKFNFKFKIFYFSKIYNDKSLSESIESYKKGKCEDSELMIYLLFIYIKMACHLVDGDINSSLIIKAIFIDMTKESRINIAKKYNVHESLISKKIKKLEMEYEQFKKNTDICNAVLKYLITEVYKEEI